MQTEETNWPAEGVEQGLIAKAPVIDAVPTEKNVPGLLNEHIDET